MISDVLLIDELLREILQRCSVSATLNLVSTNKYFLNNYGNEWFNKAFERFMLEQCAIYICSNTGNCVNLYSFDTNTSSSDESF